MMERLFRLSNRQTTVRTEVLGWRDDVFDDGLHNLRSARCAFWKNVRHAYGPGVWCRHDIDMCFSGAGNSNHGTLCALSDRAGTRDV